MKSHLARPCPGGTKRSAGHSVCCFLPRAGCANRMKAFDNVHSIARKISGQRVAHCTPATMEPGIRRKRAGGGFRYLTPGGDRLQDADTLARIRSLAIPPAWSDVWISPHPDGHLQATGRDQRGRKQYRYHPRWSACRDEVKYSSLTAFAEALPRLRNSIDADLGRRGFPRERVVASVVWLLDNTMIRVGNPAYMRATTTVSASLRCATGMSRSPVRQCVLRSWESRASNGD